MDGVSTGSAANTLLLQVGQASVYTAHLHATGGSMRIWAMFGSTPTSSVQIGGDGGFRVALPAGPVRVKLESASKSGSTVRWTVMLGIAPKVSDFKPANGPALKQPPATIDDAALDH